MREFTQFYSGKRVLVTGHTGFKGSWMAAWLKTCGADVTGLSLAPEEGRPSLFEDAGIASGMTSHIGDIRDFDLVRRLFDEVRPEIVFHLAAQPLVRRSYRDPLTTYGSNVMGTVHVLEAARQTPSVRTVVAVTTDKCYANEEWVWPYRETDRLGGKDPYSNSKACAELVVDSYRSSIFAMDGRVKVATARGGNVIGGGDWSEDRLVPDIVRSIAADETVVLRNPGAVRPWQHVLELVRGYMVLARRLHLNGDAFASGWNFGPDKGNEVTVETLTRKMLSAWSGTKSGIRVEQSPLAEANYLRLDHSKAVSLLGWRPILDFDATISLTTDWYRRYATDPSCAGALVAEQIGSYLSLAPSLACEPAQAS
jgi:CDP-glucose 4,6-dehydratase